MAEARVTSQTQNEPQNKSLRSARKEEEEAFTSTSSITAPRETERHMTGGVGHMTHMALSNTNIEV